jgi:hypothetical protein
VLCRCNSYFLNLLLYYVGACCFVLLITVSTDFASKYDFRDDGPETAACYEFVYE